MGFSLMKLRTYVFPTRSDWHSARVDLNGGLELCVTGLPCSQIPISGRAGAYGNGHHTWQWLTVP